MTINFASKFNKKSTIIAIVLMMTMVSAMVFLPTAKAADVQVYAFLDARPNPVGVGQQVLVSMFVDRLPPSFGGVWANFTLTITDPDGNSEKHVMDSDPVAAQWMTFNPDQAGEWTLEFEFVEQTYGETTYLGDDAASFTLTVQEEPIPEYPWTPLPTEYWERPINAQNRDWYNISNNWYGLGVLYGNTWMGTSNWVKYGSAPDSPHVLWTYRSYLGGLVGDVFGSYGDYFGLSYENKWTPPVALEGLLYYNERLGSSSSLGVRCIDIATGETLWFQEGMSISCGQILRFDSGNQHGAIPYLWSTGGNMKVYDALTGIQILSIENGSNGRYALDENGNLMCYVLNYNQRSLICWNSTKCIQSGQSGGLFGGSEFWRPPLGAEIPWANGIEYNVTIPDEEGSPSIAQMGDSIIIATRTPSANKVGFTGYSKETGERLFSVETTGASGQMFVTAESEGKWAWFRQETETWEAWDIHGTKLWGPTESYNDAWGLYTSSVGGLGGSSPVIAYNKLYAVAYDGKIRCYDMDNGDLLWTYFIGNAGEESPYGSWPFGGGLHVVADGKVYATVGEHSPTIPLIRGARMVCVDANTGDEVWHVEGWWQTPIITDGRIIAMNHYDGRIYCLGRGPSATSVSAGPKYTTLGDKVVIEGKVTDVSLGTKTGEQAARYPNGVPAIADDVQGLWMDYLYEQQVFPANATGVEVMIDVIDSNGNYRNIGTTTSDATGFYSFTWEPDISGDYMVVATFAGSNSYYGSVAETAFTVVEPTVTPAPTATPAPVTDTYVMGFGIGMIIAVIVVGLLLFLLLRKR